MEGSWQCNISAETLQERLGISRSSVERANRALIDASLIHRVNNGKSSLDPFRQRVSTTKILFPKNYYSMLRTSAIAATSNLIPKRPAEFRKKSG